MTKGLKRGIYETEYGNAAYVSGPQAQTAFDLDMGEKIPITLVSSKWLRAAESDDWQYAREAAREGRIL